MSTAVLKEVILSVLLRLSGSGLEDAVADGWCTRYLWGGEKTGYSPLLIFVVICPVVLYVGCVCTIYFLLLMYNYRGRGSAPIILPTQALLICLKKSGGLSTRACSGLIRVGGK